MIDFSKWALKNTKLVYFVLTILGVGGVYGIYNMSKLEDPRIRVKMATVVATYPGASAYQIELEVVDKLEKSIRSMNCIDEIETTCMNDVAILQVSLDWGVKGDEVEEKFSILRRKVGDIESSMPDGVSLRVVDTFGDVYGMFYALSGEGFTPRELLDYANLLKQKVQEINGISDVQIYGEQRECIDILVDRYRMSTLGVLPLEVLTTLNGQDKSVYAGYFSTGGNRLKVAVDDRFNSIDDIRNLLICGHEEDMVRLSDIARVEQVVDDNVRNSMYYNGVEAIGISISAENGTDIVKLGEKVKKVVAELQSDRFPVGISVDKVFFQPERVDSALSTFALNLVESVLIVIILLMFTMGYNSGLIIGKTLIITVLGSLLVLYLFHGELQRVSLGTFILAMGMLVDNAIVIADGILVDLQKGKPKEQALTDIGRKTAWPLMVATLIAILAFLPPFISGSTAGEYLHDLFIVLAVSLLLSWVLALFYVPVTASKRLKVKPLEEGKGAHENKAYQALRAVLGWSLRHRYPVLLASLALVAVSVICFKFLPKEFFPDMEYDQIFIEYKLPEGADAPLVKNDLDEISAHLKENPDIRSITMSLGGTPSRYNLVRSIATPSLAYGELIVDFTSADVLVEQLPDLQAWLYENYPQAVVRAKRYNLMFKKYAIELQFEGPDPAVLKELCQKAADVARTDDKIRLVTTSWGEEMPVMNIAYDQMKARQAGLSRTDVGLSLLAATNGIPVGTYYDGDYPESVYLKVTDADGRPVSDLSNLPIFTTVPSVMGIGEDDVKGLITGTETKRDIMEKVLASKPLGAVTNGMDITWDDPIVMRVDGARVMCVQCDAAFGVSTEDARASLDELLKGMDIPEGYSCKWRGEHEASAKASSTLFAQIPLAILLIIFLLILLFKDYRRPAIICCCLPFLSIGVVFGMMVSGKAFGFVAICGCLGLMGMLIKNAVILMDEIDLELSNGVEPVTALVESSASRFRPVMMASLTTVLGMIPLLKDCLFGSLAVTIMAGLTVGTLVTLLVIPVLYSIFFHIKTSYDKK